MVELDRFSDLLLDHDFSLWAYFFAPLVVLDSFRGVVLALFGRFVVVNSGTRVEKETAGVTALIEIVALARSELDIQLWMFFRSMGSQSAEGSNVDAVLIWAVCFYIRYGVVSLEFVLFGTQIRYVLTFSS